MIDVEQTEYEGPEREKFEEVIYRQYFIKHATMQGLEPGTLDKKTLMRRGSDKDYCDMPISAMWFGWYHRANQERVT